MRIDKFLKVSRLIKRRTIAKEACDQERILVNGKPAKPGTEVKLGDLILIRFGSSELKVRVLNLSEHSTKENASTMYEAVQE